MFSVSN